VLKIWSLELCDGAVGVVDRPSATPDRNASEVSFATARELTDRADRVVDQEQRAAIITTATPSPATVSIVLRCTRPRQIPHSPSSARAASNQGRPRCSCSNG